MCKQHRSVNTGSIKNYLFIIFYFMKIQAQSNQFHSYSMFKTAFKEYALVYILECGESRPTGQLAQ